jgi:hypothetical protein
MINSETEKEVINSIKMINVVQFLGPGGVIIKQEN